MEANLFKRQLKRADSNDSIDASPPLTDTLNHQAHLGAKIAIFSISKTITKYQPINSISISFCDLLFQVWGRLVCFFFNRFDEIRFFVFYMLLIN